MTCVEGERPETEADWRRVAEALRRLHRLTKGWSQRPGWRSSTELLNAETGTKVDLRAMPPEGVARCRAAWARFVGRPTCVVHGNPTNRKRCRRRKAGFVRRKGRACPEDPNGGGGLRRGRCPPIGDRRPRLHGVTDFHREATMAQMRVPGEDIRSDFENHVIAAIVRLRLRHHHNERRRIRHAVVDGDHDAIGDRENGLAEAIVCSISCLRRRRARRP